MDRGVYRRHLPAAGKARETQPDITRGYFGNADMADPIISPRYIPML